MIVRSGKKPQCGCRIIQNISVKGFEEVIDFILPGLSRVGGNGAFLSYEDDRQHHACVDDLERSFNCQVEL